MLGFSYPFLFRILHLTQLILNKERFLCGYYKVALLDFHNTFLYTTFRDLHSFFNSLSYLVVYP